MVYVPAGEFVMGTSADGGSDSERPQRRVYLDAFRVDKCEVTVAQYRGFCAVTGRSMLSVSTAREAGLRPHSTPATPSAGSHWTWCSRG